MEIGVDIIEISRIRRACAREEFLNRFFTARELRALKAKVVSMRICRKVCCQRSGSKGHGHRFSKHEVEGYRNIKPGLGKTGGNFVGKGQRNL